MTELPSLACTINNEFNYKVSQSEVTNKHALKALLSNVRILLRSVCKVILAAALTVMGTVAAPQCQPLALFNDSAAPHSLPSSSFGTSFHYCVCSKLPQRKI